MGEPSKLAFLCAMLNVFKRQKPMFFLIRAGGAHGSWDYIQQGTSGDDAENTCRSTGARVVSIREATANDFDNHTSAKCTDRDDGRFACGGKPCEECLALTFNP